MVTHRVTRATFPLSFWVVDQGHRPRLQSTTTLRMCAHEKRRSKKVKVKSTCRANHVLMLTDYHISRHVVSTFKRLTTTTTHYGLSIFPQIDGASTSTIAPSIDLIVAACSKHPTPIILASDRKSLDFYRTISIAN